MGGVLNNFVSVAKGSISGRISRLTNFFSGDIGIDLGTANTLVFVKGKGIVLAEPSVVAVDSVTGKILAVGNRAKAMLGKTPRKMVAVRPLRNGVIDDFEVTEGLLRSIISRVAPVRSISKPRILIAVPSGITSVEKRAVKDSATRAGAREVLLIEEPIAAAIGAGLKVHEPSASMVVDIGGGTTEIAIISLGGIVDVRSVRVAGDELDGCIVNYMKDSHGLIIGAPMAENIKIAVGSAYPLENELEVEVSGIDVKLGLPAVRRVTSVEIREQAIQRPLGYIISCVKESLGTCHTEFSSDLIAYGMVLTGGGALIRGICSAISEVTGLPVRLSEDPLLAVCRGTGVALDHMDTLCS